MIGSLKGEHKTLLGLLESIFDGMSECEEIDLDDVYRLGDKKVRIPAKWLPIQLTLSPSGKVLHLYREWLLGKPPSSEQPLSVQLLDPDNYFTDVSGFIRLSDGDSLTLSRSDAVQRRLLNLPPDISERHISISNKSGQITIRDHSLNAGNQISSLAKEGGSDRVHESRCDKLRYLRDLFGGEMKPLATAHALDLVRQVNEVLATEAYRKPDNAGRPGGIISLPKRLTPVIVGDLHAKVNNLLVVLSQGGVIDGLVAGRTCLVIIGDAVHSDETESLEEMESSMLMMDLIFKLKMRFPQQVFYLLGNHDSFSADIGKGGIPQGLLWEKALISMRGKEYFKEMRMFYRLTAFIATSKHFISCHAGPPVSKFSRGKLVNIRDNEDLAQELVTVRYKNSRRPGGYGKKDIKKLRETLEADKGTPVIVGHTPVNDEDTIWENAGDISNHHIVYSAATDWVGAMALVGDAMQALRYRVEPAIDFINALEDD